MPFAPLLQKVTPALVLPFLARYIAQPDKNFHKKLTLRVIHSKTLSSPCSNDCSPQMRHVAWDHTFSLTA
jgi:hypothetical protein